MWQKASEGDAEVDAAGAGLWTVLRCAWLESEWKVTQRPDWRMVGQAWVRSIAARRGCPRIRFELVSSPCCACGLPERLTSTLSSRRRRCPHHSLLIAIISASIDCSGVRGRIDVRPRLAPSQSRTCAVAAQSGAEGSIDVTGSEKTYVRLATQGRSACRVGCIA